MDSTAEKSVNDLVMTAGRFCRFIEDIVEYNNEQAFEFLNKILPVLYIKGNILPMVQSCEEEMIEHFVTEESWNKVLLSLKEKFGELDAFSIVNNDKAEEEITKVLLSEFIADIYQDLKDFLLLFGKNTKTTQECALYECKRLYIERWGLKIPYIMTELHKILFNHQINKTQQNDWQ